MISKSMKFRRQMHPMKQKETRYEHIQGNKNLEEFEGEEEKQPGVK